MMNRSSLLRSCVFVCLAFVLGILLVPMAANAMTFSLVRLQGQGFCKPECPVVIYANGQITSESPNEFYRFVTTTPGIGKVRNAIMINSPGGQVVGALMLGLVWKELKMVTYVAEPVLDGAGNATAITPARCYSACAYALMGARTRIVPEGSQVGIHRMHSFAYQRDPAENRFESRHIFAPDSDVEILRRYTRIVGIDPKLIDLAETVSPTSIRVLTQAEMKAMRVTTATVGGTRQRKANRN
jgi:hypothetical protein